MAADSLGVSRSYTVPWRDGPASDEVVSADMWALYQAGIPAQWLIMVAELVS